MELSDLLVSYKRVDAPRFTPSIPIIEQFPSYQTPTDKETNAPSLPVQAKPTTSYSITSVQVPGFKAKWTSPYRDRNKWVSDLTQAYRRAGITNDNALKMLIAQDALESAWGRSAQGKFNFGNLTTGAKWKGDYVTGNDHDAAGNPIKQKFRSYNSIDEYAADKIQFLKRLYDFNENDDINKFTAKLTGSNKGKRRYAEATNYADSLTKVFNSFKKGGVIKAQTGTIIPDNTRVVKPTIQEKIQRTYPIQQQPQFVQDNRSDWERQQSYDKAQAVYNQYMQDKKTEEGLRNLNGFLTFTDYATMGLGAGSLLAKGMKWAGKKAIGQVSKQIANSRNMGIVAKPFQKGGEDYTENLIRLLGEKKDSNVGGKFSSDTKPFARYLESIGVDVTRFSDRDLRNLRMLREESIQTNHPTGRYAKISELSYPTTDAHTVSLYEGKENIGYLNGRNSPYIDNSLHVDNMESLDFSKHGISQDLYNSSLQYGQQAGYDGLVSGEHLLSPEITTRVLEHYPNKQLVGNTGHWHFNFGKTVRNESQASTETFDNPVYKLLSPSKKPVPTKHAGIFHPSLINTKNWTLNAPDWSNPNIFKVGIPGILGFNFMNYDNNEK